MNRLYFSATRPAADEPAPPGARRRRALLDHLGWIIGLTLAGAGIGAFVALSTPPRYRVEALVQVAPRNSGQVNASAVQFDTGMLTSRAVVGPVVERLHLDVSAAPVRAPLLGALAARFAEPGHAIGPWPEGLGYAWGGERIQLDSLSVPERLLNVPLILVAQPQGHYQFYAGDAMLLEGVTGEPASANEVELQVAQIDAQPGTRFELMRSDPLSTVDSISRELVVDEHTRDAGTVRVAWRYPDRKLAAALVNGVAQAYIDSQTTQRRDDAAGGLAFVSSELPRVKGELERAEAALTRYRTRSGTMAPSQEAQSYLSGSMDYQRQIAALRLERTRLLQRFTTDSNEVRTVDTQIQELSKVRRDMDSRMQNLSETERESVALTRDVKVAEDMYMTLRNRAQQLSLAQSDRSNTMRIVDAAMPPSRPDGLGPVPLTFGGALLGLCLGLAGAAARQRYKPSVADAADAEARLGMPMLGEIAFSSEQTELEHEAEVHRRLGVMMGFAATASPRLYAPAPGSALAEPGAFAAGEGERMLRCGLHDRFLLARRSPHALAVEGLRSVRAALHFAVRNAPDGVLAVTSPAPGAGKTFASVNLAVLFAEAGQRVLLVDADLRRGKIANWFDQAPEPGLAELLAGRADLAAVVRPTVVSGLCLITAGATPTNPSELLMMPSLAEMLQVCKARFDLVIIDTPPVLAVADGTLVANLAGSTLLVVRADVTPASQVDEAVKRLARAEARLAGGMLNGVIRRRSNRADFAAMNPYLGLPLPPAQPEALALEARSAPSKEQDRPAGQDSMPAA
ncbi:polysaccharide biosynthesis tyrosine autokinase [Cupriavidus sp. M-11]|uniref:polysaccharide biosynthesis tyrosine autokinase n=1 Tax=Cupriavidus sp. M-11 TaxID=3233038 RepID=UPI003F90616C